MDDATDFEADFSAALSRILALQSEYSKDNTPPMQERGRLVRRAGPKRLKELLPETVDLDPADLDTEGRDGSGLRARIPWIRVFSSSRAPSVTQGWDVVYLFAADGSAVFLSLNQGTTSASGGSLTDRPEDFLRRRVEWAKGILREDVQGLAADELALKDSGGLGAGYEKGNVVAQSYVAGAVPDEEMLRRDLARFVDMLAHLYRAEEDPELSVGLPTYDQGLTPADQGNAPSLEDIPAFVRWMRELYGPEVVPSRLDAEQEARDLLNAYAGAMSKDQALELGRLFNKGIYGAVMHSNRFSPAFVGATMDRVIEPLDEFNQWTARLWKATEESALEAVDDILKNPSAFPGAGRSYTTMLMYLRDSEKFAVWLRITHDGLSALTDFSEPSSRVGGVRRYLRFCDAARKFAAEYGVEPQELDAIFAQAARVGAKKKVLPPPEEKVEKRPDSPSLAQVAKTTYMPIEILEEWADLLRGPKRQALFYGPPGTGKSFLAEHLATYLAGGTGLIERAQFHPSYSYEDFIEGLRPEVGPQGMTYEVRPGSFRAFCESVRDRPGTHVFIIDEINRAEIGSVLGELMLLLEYRDQEILLPYSQTSFSVPKGVVVLATMNTADRSLALVDFALRRRFHAFQLLPSRDVLAKWAAGRGAGAEVVLRFFDLIQEAVQENPDYAPGHSYWMVPELTTDELFKVWKYELRPYLAEYWFEHPGRLAELDTAVGELLAEEA